MSSSKSRDKRRDKYSSAAEATFMFHKGQKVPFGVPEMLRHCDAQWYAYPERLINNPDEPNPLEQYQDAVLRQGLKDQKRGYIDLSQEQIRAKRHLYVSKLEAGEPPYSDTDLYGVGYVNDDGEMIDSQTGEVIPFVPVVPAN